MTDDADDLAEVVLALYSDPSESQGLTVDEWDALIFRLACVRESAELQRREVVERERAPKSVRRTEPDRSLNVDEVAQRLGVDRPAVYRMRLPFEQPRLGKKRRRWSARGLERWLARRRAEEGS